MGRNLYRPLFRSFGILEQVVSCSLAVSSSHRPTIKRLNRDAENSKQISVLMLIWNWSLSWELNTITARPWETGLNYLDVDKIENALHLVDILLTTPVSLERRLASINGYRNWTDLSNCNLQIRFSVLDIHIAGASRSNLIWVEYAKSFLRNSNTHLVR